MDDQRNRARLWSRLAAIAMAVVLAAGCGRGSGSPSTSATTGGASGGSGASATAAGSSESSSAAASSAASGAASSALSSTEPSASAAAGGSAGASAGAGTFVNPVIDTDFPDPYILHEGDTYYAYATTNGSDHIQLEESRDLVTWTRMDDPLPNLPSWSKAGSTWAPEVVKIGKRFVLYYTTHDDAIARPDGNGSQCVSVAVSDKPEGPFVDDSTKPLVCQAELGGTIDATAFVDSDGKRYLIYKNDGNCCQIPAKFWIQPMTEDGLELTGKATDMGLVNDTPWEGGVIEAPTLILHDGTYDLFYSGNAYDSEFYAVGYATSKNVLGPYTDAPENPILSSAWGGPVTSRARGPGHQSVVADKDGDLWMVYHAWDEEKVGFGNRTVWLDKLTFKDGKPTVTGPTGDPQPIP